MNVNVKIPAIRELNRAVEQGDLETHELSSKIEPLVRCCLASILYVCQQGKSRKIQADLKVLKPLAEKIIDRFPEHVAARALSQFFAPLPRIFNEVLGEISTNFSGEELVGLLPLFEDQDEGAWQIREELMKRYDEVFDKPRVFNSKEEKYEGVVRFFSDFKKEKKGVSDGCLFFAKLLLKLFDGNGQFLLFFDMYALAFVGETLQILLSEIGVEDQQLDGRSVFAKIPSELKEKWAKDIGYLYSLSQVDTIYMFLFIQELIEDTSINLSIKRCLLEKVLKSFLESKEEPINQLKVLQLIHESGIIDIYNKPYLASAVYGGNLAVVDYLLRQDLDVNQVFPDFLQTPLMIAASKGHLPAVIRLVERGADISRIDGHGLTALQLAQESHAQEVVDYLVSLEVDG